MKKFKTRDLAAKQVLFGGKNPKSPREGAVNSDAPACSTQFAILKPGESGIRRLPAIASPARLQVGHSRA